MRFHSLCVASFILLAACGSNGLDNADGGDDQSASPTDLGDDGLGDPGDLGAVEPDGGVTPVDAGGVGQIACGNMPCDVTANVCCISNQMMMTSATCEPAAMCNQGISRACDGPEDCTAAGMNVCCARILGATSCAAKCNNAGQQQLCHDKSECPTPMQANRVAACCPITQTLRGCRTLMMGQPTPPGCD